MRKTADVAIIRPLSVWHSKIYIENLLSDSWAEFANPFEGEDGSLISNKAKSAEEFRNILRKSQGLTTNKPRNNKLPNKDPEILQILRRHAAV